MTRGLRESLGVRALAVKAATRSGELSFTEGETDGGSAVEFPILQGKMVVGGIWAFLDENQLYRTVLVPALELLDSFAGTVFLEHDGVVSVGFEDQEERLQALGRVTLPDHRKPFMGRMGNGHAVGSE